jgi:hypothetical protein
MAGKSNAFETDLLELIFNGTAIANIADNASSSPATNLYVSLHTGDPTDAGDQTSNECAYTSYTRVAVARGAGGWTITGDSVSPVSNIQFAECTGGTESVTHWAIGLASTGSGYLLYAGTVSPTIAITNGVTPILTTASSVTED